MGVPFIASVKHEEENEVLLSSPRILCTGSAIPKEKCARCAECRQTKRPRVEAGMEA